MTFHLFIASAWLLICFDLIFIFPVKLIGKLQDGTVFLKKGHDDEGELFEFKTDEGNLKCPCVLHHLLQIYFMLTSLNI